MPVCQRERVSAAAARAHILLPPGGGHRPFLCERERVREMEREREMDRACVRESASGARAHNLFAPGETHRPFLCERESVSEREREAGVCVCARERGETRHHLLS